MRRRVTVAFALVAALLVTTAAPASAAHAAVVVDASSAFELQDGASLTNSEVVRSGEAGAVEHDQARSSAVARWAMDEGSGSTAHDHVGSNDGTIDGATWTSGVRGEALSFRDSGDARVSLSSNPTPSAGSAFTYSFWINRDSSGWVTDFDSGGGQRLGVFIDGGGNLEVQMDGFERDIVSIPSGDWHHIVVTTDGSTVRVYLDGELQHSFTDTGQAAGTNENWIGDAPGGGGIDGSIDDPRFFHEELSPGLATRLAELPNGKLSPTATERWALDAGQGSTGYGDAGVDALIEGDPTWTNGVAGRALDFDGQDDWLSPSSVVFNQDSGTWSTYVYGNFSSISDGDIRLFNSQNSSGIDYEFRTYGSGWSVRNNDGSAQKSVDAGPLPDDTWTHLAFTWQYYSGNDTTVLKAYQNGVKQDTVTLPGKIAQPDELEIAQWAGNAYYPGQLDEFRIYNSELSQDSIQHIHQNPAAEIPETSRYERSDSVSDATEATVDLELDNTSAQVVMTDGGTEVANQTVNSSGEHTLDFATVSSDSIDLDVQFSEEAPDNMARLHDYQVSAEMSEPTVDDSTASPNSTDSSLDETTPTLSVDVADADFATTQGDTITATWYVDGEQIDQTTTSSNGTISTEAEGVTSGEHTWHVELEDEFGHSTTSGTYEFVLPSTLNIYNESAPTELVDNASAEAIFYFGDDEQTIVERDAPDGQLNLTGLPANEPFVVVVDAQDYRARRIFVESLVETQSVYLLPESEEYTEVTFELQDTTGRFPNHESVLIVERNLNESWGTVQGDYFGAGGDWTAQLRYNERHRLTVLNTETGEREPLGTFTPTTSGTRVVRVTSDGAILVDATAVRTSIDPQVRSLPADGGATFAVELLEENATVEEWSVTATAVSDDDEVIVYQSTELGAGTIQPEVNLTGFSDAQLVVDVEWTTTDGLEGAESVTFSIREQFENDYALLSVLAGIPNIFPSTTASTVTGIFALLGTFMVTVAVAASLPVSTEVNGLVAVVALSVFGVIGWVTYDVVFAAGVGWLAFAGLRRGFR